MRAYQATRYEDLPFGHRGELALNSVGVYYCRCDRDSHRKELFGKEYLNLVSPTDPSSYAHDNLIMDETQDFKSLQDHIQSSLLSTTRISGQISSEDLLFQRSLNPQVGTSLDEQTERLLELANALLESAASVSGLQAPVLDDAEDVDSNWRGVVDVLDTLLEKTDIGLDEYTGVIKRRETPTTDQVGICRYISPYILCSLFQAAPKARKNPYSLGSAFRTQNLVKPQLAFEVKPNNHDNSPWKPLLTSKPHAKLPLEESLGIFKNEWDQPQYDYPALTTFTSWVQIHDQIY